MSNHNSAENVVEMTHCRAAVVCECTGGYGSSTCWSLCRPCYCVLKLPWVGINCWAACDSQSVDGIFLACTSTSVQQGDVAY